jgi:RHS repeat-associated protein
MRRSLIAIPLMVLALCVVVGLFSVPRALAAYTYYYTLTPASFWNAYGVVTMPDSTWISIQPQGNNSFVTALNTDNSGGGEMKVTLSYGGDPYASYTALLGASYSGSPGTQGSLISQAYYVQVTTTSVSVSRMDQTYGTTAMGSAALTLQNGIVLRLVNTARGQVAVYANNALVLACTDPIGSLSGYMGVIENYSQIENGDVISQIDLGYLDTIGPTAIPSSSITVTPQPTSVGLQWAAAVDDANGPGIAFYLVSRNSSPLTYTANLSYSDTTVAPDTQYSYTISAFDFDLNVASTTVSVTTPLVPTNGPFPSVVPDGRRVGVRPTGAYWGAGNEEIDVMSGNVNFTTPLINAMQRGGASVGFNLTYNSQNWREYSGASSQFGEDTGYGYGWKLMAGSITPVFSSPQTLSYFLFTDSTGAQYQLNQTSGDNVWTSQNSIYLKFNANTNVLYFSNGAHWTFDCISAASEPDAGVMYPTLMEDTNGNDIAIAYNTAAAGANWTNSSSRIATITDVRGVSTGPGTYATYVFYYTTFSGDAIPHLTTIINYIGTSEAYTFSYTGVALTSPFGGSSVGNARLLTTAETSGISTTYQFSYSSNNSGELTQAVLPFGGYLAWAYDSVTYSSGITYREVSNRYLSKDGSSTTATYAFSHESTPGPNVRQYTILEDPSGVGEKCWAFGQSGVTLGLLTSYQGRSRPGTPGSTSCPQGSQGSYVEQESDVTWTQDSAGNSYISNALQKMDPGQTYEADTQTGQALDVNGNVTQVAQYDFGNLSTPLRTYNYTYLNSNAYTSLNMYNRLTQATVTTGSTNTTLATLTYDQGFQPSANVNGQTPPFWNMPAYYQQTSRGNLTGSTTLDSSITTTYDTLGNPTSITQNGVSINVSTASSSNFVVPTAISAGSLTETIDYESFLARSSTTGANTDTTTMSYDVYSRPTGGTSPFGATTSIAYNSAPYTTSNPATSTTTIDGRWTTLTIDGLGRTVLTQSGDASGTKSQAESVYGPCGCSPIGKLMQQAMPHTSGTGPVYTTYTYDGIGRTLTTVAPDGTSTTTYAYQGNTVTVTDPAGAWKTFTVDMFGNLKQVQEPNPAGGSNFVTSYTYDVLNNLTGVSMQRPSGTQTRSFVYTGHLLTSATNPENGTVTYAYNSNNKLATRTDAIGQHASYTYDSLGRLTKLQRFNQSNVEDLCEQENYSYDSNPYNPSFSQNVLGRLAAVRYYGGVSCATTFTENYNYLVAGGRIAKQVQVTRTQNSTQSTATLEADYTYDTEGRVATIQYPSSTPVLATAAPTFSPAPGAYSNHQNVTISTTSSGATIRYTLDGSTPTETTGTVYSGPIRPNGGTTIKAIAYASGLADSTVTSGTYNVGVGPVIAPTFSPAPGTYSSSQSVTLTTTTSGATIRYTLDGTTPTETNGIVYSGAITVSNSQSIQAIAYDSGMTDSQITTAAYLISGTVTPGPHLGISYDTMGRPLTLTDLETNDQLISNTTYGPSNELLKLYGTINETRIYNSMLQLTSLVSSNASGTSVNLTYTYSGTQNNGKITGQTDNISGEQVVYTYDMLKRLATATAGSTWGQSYGYDGFDNLQSQTVTAGSAPSLSVVYNYANNRQTTDCADANGNIDSAAGGCGTTSYNYDVSNRVVSLASSSPSWQYSYAPRNRRIWRGVWTGSTQTTDEVTFWAGNQKLGTWALSWSGSQLTATMTTSDYYFAGRLIKNNTGYVASDHLGSIGKFYPYGQEKPSATTNGTEKFTGYYRDSETGNDYAINRYHQPGMGRFLTVDPHLKSAKPANPGSWNRYAYVLGDPVNGTDPKGLELADCGDPFGPCDCTLDGFCFYEPVGSGDGGGGGGRGVCPSTTLGALAKDAAECAPAPPPAPPPLSCQAEGAITQQGQWVFEAGASTSYGWTWAYPISLLFQASGGAGDGSYQWTEEQYYAITGAVTYSIAGSTNVNINDFENLTNEGTPGGAISAFPDAPGLQATGTYASTGQSAGVVVAANVTFNFSSTASVTSGGVTAGCQGAIDWSLTENWLPVITTGPLAFGLPVPGAGISWTINQ